MKSRTSPFLQVAALSAIVTGIPSSAPAAVTILTGDRHIEDEPVPDNEAGSLSLEGILTVGVLNVSSIDTSGFALEHVDKSSPDPDNDVISFIANENYAATWNWAYGNPTSTLQMSLDTTNKLSLHSASTPITLDPANEEIKIGANKVVTEGNGSTLLSGSFIPRNGSGSLDSFLMEGTYIAPATNIPATGEGTRMMWYPESAAFRAGHLDTGTYATRWDDANVGEFSTAFGRNTQASGDYSFAAGEISNASGTHASAFGRSTANGNFSTSMGNSYATGTGTTVMGISYNMSGDYHTVAGSSSTYANNYVTAMGQSAASGDYATAMGSSQAYGHYSGAIGDSWANAHYSTAMGTGIALGEYATAMGKATVTSYGSTAVGIYNEDLYDKTDPTTTAAAKTTWKGDNQHSAFEVGVGTSSAPADLKNGFTVFQDGSVDVGKASNGNVPLAISASDESVTLSKAQGDISMGLFGN